MFDRNTLLGLCAGDSVGNVKRLIENGEEARRIFAAIAECAAGLEGVDAAAIFLASDTSINQQELIANHGPFEFAGQSTTDDGAVNAPQRNVHGFNVVCLGAPIGSVQVHSTEAALPAKTGDALIELAHHTSVVFERQRLANTLQHFLDRLQVLNEINQLIASNVGLQRIVKSLARESAFRFAADISLAFVLSEDKTSLEVKGGYGCAPNLVPKQLAPDRGVLGQVMRVGGHLSIGNLRGYPDHGLEFIEALEIQSADICCLEVRGEPLGVILIGYKHENTISPSDLTRFEEFCQGAAVAIANARTQERIQSYTERLEELVEQRTSDLAVQTARAEDANKAKSQFLANMSHELRTPLTAIVGYSSVIADGIFGALNDKQKDALTAITRSSEHLKNLIDEVLNLARIESGKEQAEPARVLVRDLVVQTQKLLLQPAISKGVNIQPLKIPEEVLSKHLFVDQKHVHQILINLLSNAVKYTPKGGTVWMDAEIVGDKVKINVHDTGVGISAQKMAKLFERFERGEDAYSKSQEGTGIGLNLTRQLVELNGGRIGVESNEGEGSVFWIMLPLATNETEHLTKQDTPEARVTLDGLSVLVVDDNPDTCEVLKQILVAAHANVHVTHCVADAIAAVGSGGNFDIVLTDLAMPGDSGLVLIEHIRSSPPPLAQLPIIVLSACAFQSDQDSALQAGANLFVPKPFRPNEITKNVRQLTFATALQSGMMMSPPPPGPR